MGEDQNNVREKMQIEIPHPGLVLEKFPDGKIGRSWQVETKLVGETLTLGIALRHDGISIPHAHLFQHLILGPEQFKAEVIKAIEELEAENEKAKNNKPPNERG